MDKYLIDSKGRECSRCKSYKNWCAFYKDANGTRGRSTTCKACRSDINAANNPKTGVQEGFNSARQQFCLGILGHK